MLTKAIVIFGVVVFGVFNVHADADYHTVCKHNALEINGVCSAGDIYYASCQGLNEFCPRNYVNLNGVCVTSTCRKEFLEEIEKEREMKIHDEDRLYALREREMAMLERGAKVFLTIESILKNPWMETGRNPVFQKFASRMSNTIFGEKLSQEILKMSDAAEQSIEKAFPVKGNEKEDS